MSPSPALEVRGLSKTFTGQRALVGVDLELQPGEIRALVGQNGCGKSTMIKVLAGYHDPDPGAEVHVDGQPLALGTAGARTTPGCASSTRTSAWSPRSTPATTSPWGTATSATGCGSSPGGGSSASHGRRCVTSA